MLISKYTKALRDRIERGISLTEYFVFPAQNYLLGIVLNNARKNVPFYYDLSKSKKLKKITDFPIVDKHFISSRFEQFVSNKVDSIAFHEAFTGGSTGSPFRFYMSGGYEYDFGKRRLKNYGYCPGELILALDGSKLPDEDVKKGIYWKMKNTEDVPFGSIAMSSLYLTDKSAPIYCGYIQQLRPSFIRGYPNFVYEIAKYSESLNLNMKGFLKSVELTSETALKEQIEAISRIFGCPVYLQYGHTEGCVCAYTYDNQYKYRVEPLYGYVEVLNENGVHVKVGEVGEVVVTTLHNFAMPLIRYRTGDLAEYGGRDNRYIYLNTVLGRTQDFIINRNNNKILLTSLIFAQHFKALGNIMKWQIEQFEIGKVYIHIIKGQYYSLEDEDEIRKLFNSLGGVDVEFHYCSCIPLTPRGKSKMLIQHLTDYKC